MSYTIAEQAKFRSAILAYGKAHEFGVIRLSRRIKEDTGIEVPVKTLQRHLAGKRVNDMALSALAKFTDKLEDPITALGEALHRLQGTLPLMDISGDYSLLQGDVECPVTITRHGDYFWRMILRDKNAARIYDGVVVCTGGVFVAHLRDKLFGLPRHYHFTRPQYGFFCDVDRADKIAFEKTNA